MNSFTKVRKTENDICFFKKRGPFRRFESIELNQYNKNKSIPAKFQQMLDLKRNSRNKQIISPKIKWRSDCASLRSDKQNIKKSTMHQTHASADSKTMPSR